MLLEFHTTFNLHRDVIPWILSQESPDTLVRTSRTLRIINVEKNENILYTWKGKDGFTSIGLYDPAAKQNELLYSIERDVNIISCSVNPEKNLLALSYWNPTCGTLTQAPSPVSRYLALIVEIKPINNVRVIKAVDSSVRVQFIYPGEDRHASYQSHLLVVSEEKYIEQFHVSVGSEDGSSIVMKNTGPIPKDRVAEDFVWAQWDMTDQRLFYIIQKRSSCVLHCIQFHQEGNFKSVFEVPLEISYASQGVSLINFGYDASEERGRGKSPTPNLQVFTNNTGGLCLFYYQPQKLLEELTYLVAFLHKGYSKTFKASVPLENVKQLKRVSFINIGAYVAVYLPDQFLHLINTRYPDLMCYHFFLEGENARISGMCSDCPMQSFMKNGVIEYCTGILFSVGISHAKLLKFLTESRRDCDRLAALHCFLLHLDLQPQWEKLIIEWICDNLSTCLIFDPIQEFIIASLHRYLSLETTYLDKLLPYTSVPSWNKDIDGVTSITDITDMPILKTETFKGSWEKFYSELEYLKQTQQRFLYSCRIERRDWCKLISQLDTNEKRNHVYQHNILENTKKVLLRMDLRRNGERTLPLYQEDDYQQRDLMGLMMVKLKDHLSQHMQHVGRNKIDKIVQDFVSKQLDLVYQILEVVWSKHSLDSSVFCLDGCANSSEYFAFHVMCQISEAASRMCMPLPPGFQTLHLVIAVRCLPLGNLLHYIENGALPLTETFVVKLLKELDDSDKNEKLKCSVIIRLPENICEKVHRMWDHALSNNIIAMKYVKKLLFRLNKREVIHQPVMDRSPRYINFLPLNYLILMLSAVEDRALNPFEEDTIDAAFLEEIALKRTSILLGLQKC